MQFATASKSKPTLQVEWGAWFDYTYQNVQSYAPLAAGVYVITTKLNSGNLRVFYVGQTDSLDRRLKEHLSDNEKNACIKNNVQHYQCMFRYAKVSSQFDRDKAERALYRRFTPSCNDPNCIPDVDDVEINF